LTAYFETQEEMCSAPKVKRRPNQDAAERGEDGGAADVEGPVLEEKLLPRCARASACDIQTSSSETKRRLAAAPHPAAFQRTRLADDVAQQVEAAGGDSLDGNRVAALAR
jgi:hypothetical protein